MLKKSKSNKKKITKKMRNAKRSRKVKGGTIHTVSKNTVSKNTVSNTVNKYMSLRKRNTPKKDEAEIVKFMEKEKRNQIKNMKIEKKMNEWKEIANKQFNKKEYQEYRDIIKKTVSDIEQDWVDNNLQIIIDFMGLSELWEILIPNIDLRTEGRNSSNILISDRPVAIYSGSHWISRKAGDSVWFDPYKEYQINGSNQFCQTYSMMYLLNALPSPKMEEDEISFMKFYEYTDEAIKFIKEIMDNYLIKTTTIINNKIDNLINTLNDNNKNDKNIKKIIKGYLFEKDNESESEFNKRYDIFTVENIKNELTNKKYTEENINKHKKAVEECSKNPNICLNSIEYDFKLAIIEK